MKELEVDMDNRFTKAALYVCSVGHLCTIDTIDDYLRYYVKDVCGMFWDFVRGAAFITLVSGAAAYFLFLLGMVSLALVVPATLGIGWIAFAILTGAVTSVAVFGSIYGLITFIVKAVDKVEQFRETNRKKNIAKGITVKAPKEPSFLVEMYRAHKQKYCLRVSVKESK